MKYRTTTSGFDAGLNCVLSDLTPDAYGDIVGDPADPMLGWNISDFKRNPIALWSHDNRSPIGTWRDVQVKDAALRGRLHLAPPGSTKLVDELHALLAANVLKGISVGFKPVESKPRANGGGMHYLRQTLVEASLVAVPANPSALLQAQAMGISRETIQKVFKTEESLGERIRRIRRITAKLKVLLAKETRSNSRASLMKSIERLDREETELLIGSTPELDRARAESARKMEVSAMEREVARLMREEMKSASWQSKNHTRQIIEAFTRQAQRHPQDPKPFVPSGGGHGTWRGKKIPGPTWRGKPVR